MKRKIITTPKAAKKKPIAKPKPCDHCPNQSTGLIECPTCSAWCCEDCIGGNGVACFDCENGGNEDEDQTDGHHD
jgi:hypothetical protein